MRQKLESQDEEVLDFKENFSSLQQEIDYKTRKLRKMYSRWMSLKQEMGDLSDEFRNQRRELEQTQEMLMKELRLKQVIINNFIPHEFKRQMTHRLNYDEDEQKWSLAPPENLLPLRNRASKSEIRPTSDFEKAARLAEDPLNLGRYKASWFHWITSKL